MNVIQPVIFFDIDNTLLDHSGSEDLAFAVFYNEFKQYLDFSLEKGKVLWKQLAQKHYNTFLKGEISFSQQQIRRVKDFFGVAKMKLTDADAKIIFNVFSDAYKNHWRLFSDVLPCLEQLKSHRLGIISNGDHVQQIDKLKKTNIIRYFSSITTASEAGYSKPDSRIFLSACKKMGAQAMRCFHVGDDLQKDVLASQKAGMHSIWLKRAPLQNSSKDTVYTTHINELTDLPSYIV